MPTETTLKTAEKRLWEAQQYHRELKSARAALQASTAQPDLKLIESLDAFHGLVALLGVINFNTEPFSAWKEKYCARFERDEKSGGVRGVVKSIGQLVDVPIDPDGETMNKVFGVMQDVLEVLGVEAKQLSELREKDCASSTKIDWDADRPVVVQNVTQMVHVSIDENGDKMSSAVSRLDSMVVDYRTRAAHFSTHNSSLTESVKELRVLHDHLKGQLVPLNVTKAALEQQKREFKASIFGLEQQEMDRQCFLMMKKPSLPFGMDFFTDVEEVKASQDLSVTQEKLSKIRDSLGKIYTAINSIERDLREAGAHINQIDHLQPMLQAVHSACEADFNEVRQTVTHLQRMQQAWGLFRDHVRKLATVASAMGSIATTSTRPMYTSMVLQAVNQGVPLQTEPGVRKVLCGILAEVDTVMEGQHYVGTSFQQFVMRLRKKLNGDNTQECLTALLQSEIPDPYDLEGHQAQASIPRLVSFC
ncbi:hypothetical protein AtubIFM57258_003832 [Aspergillus tubingensis]|nr:hypothetical protein AtubIFM57258_003832 [Aspergillus tubingensis]